MRVGARVKHFNAEFNCEKNRNCVEIVSEKTIQKKATTLAALFQIVY